MHLALLRHASDASLPRYATALQRLAKPEKAMSVRAMLEVVPYLLTVAVQDALVMVRTAPNNPVHNWLLEQPEFVNMLSCYEADMTNGVRRA